MLETSLLVALVVLFLNVTTWEGMINEWVKRVTFNWPDYFKKPLFDCPICMAPWWGSLILIVGYQAGALPAYNWFEAVCILFAAGGINAVLIYIITANKEEVKALKDDE